MEQLTLDETDYTTILAGHLNSYTKSKTDHNFPAPSTPHSKRQSYKNLDKSSCFDLIQRISESSLLILEVKVTHNGIKLHSFNEQQRIIDCALRDIGIPLEYCYNNKDDYHEVNDAEYTLLKTMTSHPLLVCDEKGKITKQEQHIDLKKLVDKLISSDNSNAGMIGALFSNGLILRMRDLNIKALFFSAHAGDLTLYSEEDIYDIYECYSKNVSLGKGIDLEKATRAELTNEFKSCAEKLKNTLAAWEAKKKRDNNPETPDSFEFSF
jgi:hypothetical protein